MTQDFASAWAFVGALAGDPNTAVMDWRAINDRDKADKGHARRGTLSDWWNWLVERNSEGYGIFATIAAMDGNGRHLENVAYLRANYVDCDGPDAMQQLERAAGSYPTPAFYVQTSPGKCHVYWPLQPYAGNDRFKILQRKLRQTFNGDGKVIDAARVMRVPGFYHCKGEPHLVTMAGLPGWGYLNTVDMLETAYAGVAVIETGDGERSELGDPEKAAPSLEWIKTGLDMVDPNQLERDEWIAITAAVKQAGWSFGADAIRALWDAWCARYEKNDLGENEKQWNDLRQTQLGWQSFINRVPGLKAMVAFQGVTRTVPTAHLAMGEQPAATATPVPPLPEPPALDCSGEILTHVEQQQWFKGCIYVSVLGKILTPKGRFLGPTQFNAEYGGKEFMRNAVGKTTNEAWQAATRSTLWTVPRVDHVRFLPHLSYHETVTDVLGRTGVNIYKPINIIRKTGDVTPFLRHIDAILPVASDQQILLDYLAHNAKYPGHKIPWMPVVQSAEGVGKGIIKDLVSHMMGMPYCYFPKAEDLAKSGAQFNNWMRYKLFILVDEIRVDERRDLIEVLKPMISEKLIEVQGKGVDQELEDNYSNWLSFTNYKNSVPLNKNGRRFAIFFSQLQTEDDILSRGMNDEYFNALYHWINGTGGYDHGGAIVTDWLLNQPIQRGGIPMRAPHTSSRQESVEISRSPVERAICDAIADGLQGFRGGWVSSLAAIKRVRELGVTRGNPQPHTIQTILEGLGYVACGRAVRPYFHEDATTRAELYHLGSPANPAEYGRAQGYDS